MDILIVEDELPAVQKLTKLLASTEQTPQVVGVADGIEATVSWLNAHTKPDLILMDIELSDGQCFEIFNLVDVECPVIFTTSYDEYAIESFRVNSLDYLLKPIKKEELERALQKFQSVASRNVTSVDIGYLVDDLKKQSRHQQFRDQILVKQNGQLISIDTVEIAYFYADGETTRLYTQDRTCYVVDYALDALEDMLEARQFFRINDQFIIGPKAISQIHQSFTGKLRIDLKPSADQEVLVSRERIKDFREWIGR